MQQPPLLPEETLIRVLRVSRVNGMSVLMAASIFALLAAVGGDYVGAIAGLVIAGAGAMEVHGGTLLHHYHPRGANWLVSSQLVCLLGILAYCAVRLVFVQLPVVPPWAKEMIAMDADQYGVTPEQFVLNMYRLTFLLLAVLSTVYQGRLAVYYGRRRRAIAQALEVAETD